MRVKSLDYEEHFIRMPWSNFVFRHLKLLRGQYQYFFLHLLCTCPFPIHLFSFCCFCLPATPLLCCTWFLSFIQLHILQFSLHSHALSLFVLYLSPLSFQFFPLILCIPHTITLGHQYKAQYRLWNRAVSKT